MLETLKFGEGNWANKTDSTLAYSDQYGNFQAIPFNFTRATIATRVNKAGLIESVNEGIARIDYSDSTQGALLLEPERRNLIQYSEDFSSLNIRNNAVVTSDVITSPSGLLNADKITFDGTSDGRVEASIPVTVGQPYTISLYLKNKDLSDVTQVWIGFSAASQGQYVTITNEWQRYDITTNADGTTEYPRIQFGGTGSLYAWGFQTEQGSYSTSYIPNNGEANGVTRNGEFASNSNILSSMGQTEGTMFIDVISAEADTEILSFNRSSQNGFFVFTNSSGQYRINCYLDGIVRGTALTGTSEERLKVAIAYENNNQRLYVNGVLKNTYTESWTPNNSMDSIYFNQGAFVAARGKSNISALQAFKTSLTDAQLQTLTTI